MACIRKEHAIGPAHVCIAGHILFVSIFAPAMKGAMVLALHVNRIIRGRFQPNSKDSNVMEAPPRTSDAALLYKGNHLEKG